MGMPTVISQNGTGASAIWTPDWMQTPFSVGFNLQLTGATGSVEVTYDSLAAPRATAGNVTWVAVLTSGVNATATLSSPVQGIRINLATTTATGVATASFVQATFPR